MKHPTQEQLEPLLKALDVATWAWAVKINTKKGQSCKVDWKNAVDELCDAWQRFKMDCDDKEWVCSD